MEKAPRQIPIMRWILSQYFNVIRILLDICRLLVENSEENEIFYSRIGEHFGLLTCDSRKFLY